MTVVPNMICAIHCVTQPFPFRPISFTFLLMYHYLHGRKRKARLSFLFYFVCMHSYVYIVYLCILKRVYKSSFCLHEIIIIIIKIVVFIISSRIFTSSNQLRFGLTFTFLGSFFSLFLLFISNSG